MTDWSIKVATHESAIQHTHLKCLIYLAGVHVCVLNNTRMVTRPFDCVLLTNTQIDGHARTLSDLCKRLPSERQLSSRAPYHLSHPLHQISQTTPKWTTERPSIRLCLQVFMRRNENSFQMAKRWTKALIYSKHTAL